MKTHNLESRLQIKASKSDCRYKVAAIGIDRRGRTIAIAHNTHRLMKRGGGNHAELNLIRKCPKSLKTIIICRVGNSGILRAIEPCESCKRLCSRMKIKIVTVGEYS
jgi:tRNA(Arg) A34 adenosine deaminase TadA